MLTNLNILAIRGCNVSALLLVTTERLGPVLTLLVVRGLGSEIGVQLGLALELKVLSAFELVCRFKLVLRIETLRS